MVDCEARWLVRVARFSTKTCSCPFVAAVERSEAIDSKATVEPSAEITGSSLPPSASCPAALTDSSVVVPVARSRR